MVDKYLQNGDSRLNNMKLSDIRKYRRFALDNIIQDPNITDVAGLIKGMAHHKYVLNVKDSDGNPLSEWTISSKDEPNTPSLKLSQLSKKYVYTVDNVKKALASNSLEPIPLSDAKSDPKSNPKSTDSNSDK